METNNMKAMRNKTIADIVAEKRARANKIESATGGMPNQFQRELIADLRADADELEAAAKRELADFKPKCDWSVREALNFANTLANHGWTRDANGNAAALREALEAIVRVGYPHNFQHEAPHIRGYCYDITKAIEKCFTALAAPQRNCDRFATCEESISAFRGETGNIKPLELWLRCEIQAFAEWLFASATEQKGEK